MIKKRPPITNSTIKRVSRVVNNDETIKMSGTRVKTDTGFLIDGFKGTGFETRYELMVPSSSTPLLWHPSKDKSIRILAGTGTVTLEDPDGVITEHVLKPNVELVFLRNIKYRITAVSTLEFYVSQQVKYDLNLKVLDPSLAVSREIPETLLNSYTEAVLPSGPRTSNEKTREQLANARIAAKNKVSSQVVTPVPGPEYSITTTFGKNPKPTGGNFDESGAG